MKRGIIVFLLMMSTLLVGCSLFGKNSDTSDNMELTGVLSSGAALAASVKGKYTFDDDNCNKYVRLMECLLDKTPDTAKEQTVKSFEKVMELWKGLEKTALPETCKNTMNMLEDQKDVFAKAGCAIE